MVSKIIRPDNKSTIRGHFSCMEHNITRRNIYHVNQNKASLFTFCLATWYTNVCLFKRTLNYYSTGMDNVMLP